MLLQALERDDVLERIGFLHLVRRKLKVRLFHTL